MGEHAAPAWTEKPESRLMVLSTEHWSLLATRSLTYSESLARVSMFLTILTGAVVGLAFLAQVAILKEALGLVAILILAVVVYAGVATVGRLSVLNRENALWVIGMNRIRRGYMDLYPDLEPYFITGAYDDPLNVLRTMGLQGIPGGHRTDFLQGFQTLPAMVSVIVSLVAGVWAALVVGTLGYAPLGMPVGVAAFFLLVITLFLLTRRHFVGWVATLQPKFPPPPAETSQSAAAE